MERACPSAQLTVCAPRRAASAALNGHALSFSVARITWIFERLHVLDLQLLARGLSHKAFFFVFPVYQSKHKPDLIDDGRYLVLGHRYDAGHHMG